MMSRTNLLYSMLCSYVLLLVYLYQFYQQNPSVSHLLGNHKMVLLVWLLVMGACTIGYERIRKDPITAYCFTALFVGLLGVVCIQESRLHYVCATLVFLSIMGFMVQSYRRFRSEALVWFMILQLFSIPFLFFPSSFFVAELVFILLFAIGYIYVHRCEPIV